MNDLSVGLSVCPVHCGKTADQIRMPFGIMSRTGPAMRQVVGFGDRSMGRGTFGGEFGTRHCNQWGLYDVRMRRGPLPKLLWADLFHFLMSWVAQLDMSEVYVLINIEIQ